MSKQLNICNLYIFIWVLYLFHWQKIGEAFPILESLSNFFLGVNLSISLYYSALFWARYKQTALFKSMNVLLASLVIYGFVSAMERDYVGINGTHIKSGTYMIGALRTFLPVYTCFVFTKLGYITERTIKFWFFVFFIQCIYIYFYFRVLGLGLVIDDMTELRTNNTAYLFVSILPLVYFFRKKLIIQYVIIAFLLLLTITGLKRGAILISAVATIYYFLVQLKDSSNKKKCFVIFVILLFVVVGSIMIEKLYDNSSVFQLRVENTLEGNTSNRDVIAEYLLDIYASSGILQTLFGFGADGTLEYGLYAHNDWLEMLFDQGIWGITVYSIFWFNMYKYWRKETKSNKELAFLLGLWFVCNVFRTFFSMWYSMMNIMSALPLGYCLAKLYQSPLDHKES